MTRSSSFNTAIGNQHASPGLHHKEKKDPSNNPYGLPIVQAAKVNN